ncbi:MAG: helix-turn-helix domain-containing protein [Prevotella sp.]|jgi:AraC-like DNA-binding protein
MLTRKKGYEYGIANWKDAQGKNIRTKGCILLVCEEGMAVVSVEFKQMPLRKGDVVLIFPDTMFIVNKVSELFRIRYLNVSSGLCDEATFALSSQFFDTIYVSPIFHASPDQMGLLAAWEKIFLSITQCQAPKTAYMMLRNHLQIFFTEMENMVLTEGTKSSVQPISSTRQLFNRFCSLILEYCHSEHDVKFYAGQLCITPNYLAKITGKTLNATPKEMIDRQIIMEMKQLLTTTDISIKELAACFHFDTMSYMSRFFRRHTGLSPNEFRKQ